MAYDVENIDSILLEDVLSHIHNFFVKAETTVTDCEISDGSLPSEIVAIQTEATQSEKFVRWGQWYRISGSALNDGVYLHGYETLQDETFSGTISTLAIPRPLLQVVADIQDWISKYGGASDGPYASESFGGYSYSLRTDSSGSSASGGLTGWRLAFRDRLNPWRKIY